MADDRRTEAIGEVLSLYPVFRKHLVPSVETNKLPVTKTALRVLMILHDLYPITMSHLADEIAISPQQLSKIITELESDGYVERVNDREHRRLVWAGLTEKGKELVRDHRKAMNQAFVEKFSVFSEEEQSELIDACKKVKELISRLSK